MKISEVNSFNRLRTLLSVDGLGIMSILKLVEIFGSIDNVFTLENHSSSTKKKVSSNLMQKLQIAKGKYVSDQDLYKNEIEQMEKLVVK